LPCYRSRQSHMDCPRPLLKAEVGRRLAAFEFVSNYAMLHAIAGKMADFMNAVNDKNVIVEQ
ncbi:hypothetical protein, partial [Turicimonas muris]|uniref:hypothetical protein n=1 Tax=Turicimonas muris TaxID=1796652 RepID=UPI00263B2DBB